MVNTTPNLPSVSPALQKRINSDLYAEYKAQVPHADKAVHGDLTQWQLYCAFSQLIEDMRNWKDPINASIDSRDLDICQVACIHFTGGQLMVDDALEDGYLKVTSEGYYHHIGA